MAMYEIPVEETFYGEKDEYVLLVDDLHPAWRYLHAIYEAGIRFNNAEFKHDALGDLNRSMLSAEESALCELVGCGFAPSHRLI